LSKLATYVKLVKKPVATVKRLNLPIVGMEHPH
jgi:hypothetical protein